MIGPFIHSFIHGSTRAREAGLRREHNAPISRRVVLQGRSNVRQGPPWFACMLSKNSPEETPNPRRHPKKTVYGTCFLGGSSWVWSLFWGIFGCPFSLTSVRGSLPNGSTWIAVSCCCCITWMRCDASHGHELGGITCPTLLV